MAASDPSSGSNPPREPQSLPQLPVNDSGALSGLECAAQSGAQNAEWDFPARVYNSPQVRKLTL